MLRGQNDCDQRLLLCNGSAQSMSGSLLCCKETTGCDGKSGRIRIPHRLEIEPEQTNYSETILVNAKIALYANCSSILAP